MNRVSSIRVDAEVGTGDVHKKWAMQRVGIVSTDLPC